MNTIRSIYNDDKLWWKTLKDYTETYKHQTIDTEDIPKYPSFSLKKREMKYYTAGKQMLTIFKCR